MFKIDYKESNPLTINMVNGDGVPMKVMLQKGVNKIDKIDKVSFLKHPAVKIRFDLEHMTLVDSNSSKASTAKVSKIDDKAMTAQKVKAEAEAKAKIEAEAKVKAEAEAKAKAEAEAKQKNN